MPFGSLLPKEYSFFDFFEQHASQCVEGTRLLLQMLRDVQKAETLAKEIKEVRRWGQDHPSYPQTLHKTFIAPIDRDEIHRLISGLDDILDFTEAVSERVALYEIAESRRSAGAGSPAPCHGTSARSRPGAASPCNTPWKCSRFVWRFIVSKMKATPCSERQWPGSSRALLRPHLCDQVEGLYELLEVATDACEDVANIIEGVVLEHA